MPGRQPEDWGIPLWEAIERWTPRELWERYRDLARYDIPLIILGERGDPRSDEARRLRSQISEIMVDRLVRSELIASGIAVPLKETSRRRDIRPELWPRLGFNCGFQMVIGDGLSFDQILIREAASAGSPGRPSIMPMIEAEMHRRAAHDQIESSLRREAEVLAMWASQEFPDAHVPKPKSIEKGLGRVYQQLRSTKRPDKMGDKL
jgi:hypothetical protein